MLDVLTLSRLQFAMTVSFHYVFPPTTIGLAWMLVLMEGLFLKTGNIKYQQMTRFWVSIFGLIFGIGVATGIVLEFEFGTNWATYSRYVGDIFGSALAAEGIFAFFLESGFLAILVFGWNRVSPKIHFLSTLMVALGSTFSAVWIVVANSWQQTPAGYHIVGEGLAARAQITDFWAMVFNPSSMERLSHVLGGALLTGAFLVLSISAYYLLKNREVAIAKTGIKLGLVVALIGCLSQAITGHESAIGVAHNQPAKLAAMEGHYAASAPAGLSLLGWVDEKNEVLHGISLPGVTSWLIHGDTQKPVTGLNAFAKTDIPPVNATFQFYHLMLYSAGVLVGLTLLGWLLLITRRLWTARWYFMVLVPAVVVPYIANQAGWFAAEIGRQPWIVYGLLRTSNALSRVVHAETVLASVILFMGIYLLLTALFIFLLNYKIMKGPEMFAGALHAHNEPDKYSLLEGEVND